MSRPYVCDNCDNRVSALGRVLELDDTSEYPNNNQSITWIKPRHFCSFTCLRDWSRDKADKYEINN